MCITYREMHIKCSAVSLKGKDKLVERGMDKTITGW